MKIVSKKDEKKIRKLEEKLKKVRAKFDACKQELDTYKLKLNKIYGKIPTNEVNNGRPNQ